MSHENDTSFNNPAARNWAAFSRLWPAHLTYVHDAKKQNDTYLGEQWDKQTKADVEADGRPALTINEVLKVVNAIHGHYSKTRVDIGYKPRRLGATRETAELLSYVTDATLEANNYEHVEAMMFDDGIIEDRGYLDIRMDYTKNVLGEIDITARNPRSVLIDQTADQYDPDTWNEVITDDWVSLDDIESVYGEKMRKKVELVASSYGTFGDLSVRYETFGSDGLSDYYGDGDLEGDRRIRSVRLIDRQYKKMGRVREFVDLHSGRTRPVPEAWPEERVQLAAQNYDLFVREVVAKRIRWTVSADNVVLHDDWSPYDDYTIIPYFPIFRRGRPSGIVRHLLDPQDQFNKVESQILHVINTTANSGWLVESGSLVNMTEEDLEERGAETGLVVVYGRNREKPEKITSNSIPTGLENFSARAKQHVSDIPGIGGLTGQMPNAEMSGVVLDSAMSRSLMGMQVVFDNLAFTRKLVGRKIMRLVQTHFTEPRLIRRTNWRDPSMPEEEVAINIQTANEIVNNVTIGDHDIVVSTSPAQDNFEDSQFARLVELRNAGVMIPDHHVIRLTPNLANKEAIAEEVKQMQGLGELSPLQQALQELQLQQMQLENAETEAKALKLQAEAAKMQAEAGAETEKVMLQYQDMMTQHQREVTRIKTDMAKTIANLQNKIDLAQIHSENKSALTQYTTVNKRFENEKSRDHDLQKTGLQAALKQKENDVKSANDRQASRPASSPQK